MNDPAIVPVTAERFVPGESPVWSPAERRLCFVEVRRPALHRLDPETGRTDTWLMPEVVAAVGLPATMPASCAFGGPDLDTRFVTTATRGLDADVLERQPMEGRVLALRPGVRGPAGPMFRG